MNGKQRKPNNMARLEARDIILWVLLVTICVAGGWWWTENMERKWQPTVNDLEAYRKQPMLAAIRLAQANAYQVNQEEHFSLEAIERAGQGTLIISNNDGVMNSEQSEALLAWVARGNTLITFPQLRYQVPLAYKEGTDEASKEKKKTPEEAKQDELMQETEDLFRPTDRRNDANMRDPISRFLGIYVNDPKQAQIATARVAKVEAEAETTQASGPVNNSAASTSQETRADEYDDEEDEDDSEALPPTPAEPPQNALNTPTDLAKNQSYVELPHTGRGLRITRSPLRIVNMKRTASPYYQAPIDGNLRIYTVGQGKIVVMPQNIFTYHNLQRHDNGRLLLDLLQLNPNGKQFTIVRNLKAMHWPELVWTYFPYVLFSLSSVIILWLWRHARRFGSVLPEHNLERRSLLEHIDASGRWSWRTPSGRQHLLDAARLACQTSLRRRAPELLRLTPNEQITQFAQQTGLDALAITNAWLDPAAAHPLQFTKQIQLLQQLRAHYER